MSCLLCFGVECDENRIEIVSAESRQYDVAAILHKHFGFCFPEAPMEGHICQKCWVKVSVFHEFYIYIENLHRSNETVFAESIMDDIKPTVDSDSDNWDYEFPPMDAAVDGKTKQKKGIGRTRRDNATKLENENDNADNANMDSEDTFIIVKSENIESLPESKVTSKPSRKRGRPRKGGDPVPKQEHNICVTCNIDFPTPTALYRHSKQRHEAAEFKCKLNKCVESYATPEELETHHRTQHAKTQCKKCKRSILVSQLEHHMRVQHPPGDPVICDMCGRAFVNLFLYKAHHRSVHEGQAIIRLQCDLCKQSYKNKAILARHLREHMDGPQICATCGHVSPNRRALAKHKEVHMPELKDRYKCLVCGKGFRDRIKLKEHSHIHTGSAGTHHCKECGKTFRFNSSFSLHKKTMHPKNLSTPAIPYM